MYEFAGAIGIEPTRLFAYNLKQFFAIARGFRDQNAKNENHFRRIYAVLTMAYRDPKKPQPNILNLWPIHPIDSQFQQEEEETDEYRPKSKKQELLKKWRLN